jgi:hypothetical protein
MSRWASLREVVEHFHLNTDPNDLSAVRHQLVAMRNALHPDSQEAAIAGEFSSTADAARWHELTAAIRAVDDLQASPQNLSTALVPRGELTALAQTHSQLDVAQSRHHREGVDLRAEDANRSSTRRELRDAVHRRFRGRRLTSAILATLCSVLWTVSISTNNHPALRPLRNIADHFQNHDRHIPWLMRDLDDVASMHDTSRALVRARELAETVAKREASDTAVLSIAFASRKWFTGRFTDSATSYVGWSAYDVHAVSDVMSDSLRLLKEAAALEAAAYRSLLSWSRREADSAKFKRPRDSTALAAEATLLAALEDLVKVRATLGDLEWRWSQFLRYDRELNDERVSRALLVLLSCGWLLLAWVWLRERADDEYLEALQSGDGPIIALVALNEFRLRGERATSIEPRSFSARELSVAVTLGRLLPAPPFVQRVLSPSARPLPSAQARRVVDLMVPALLEEAVLVALAWGGIERQFALARRDDRLPTLLATARAES